MSLTTVSEQQTDVLVLGAGGAGLRAAIAARRRGAEVLVVSKMPRDGRNCTDLAWGGATYSTPALEDELFRQVVETGGFLSDQRLVEAFVHDVPARVAELSDLGVAMEVLDGADLEGCLGVARVAEGVSPRGLGMTRPLRAAAEALGVRFADELMVSDLLVNDGAVGGALAVPAGEQFAPCAIAARAVLVAGGGGACLFERTDNPPGTTGDGIALAYQAGAQLVDLELISFQFPEDRMAEAFDAPAVPVPALLKTGAAHYYLGGIHIDDCCRTAVGGLFAAGEAAGGLFGAARLGGAALGDILVFGTRAGEQAAAYAAAAGEPALDQAQVQAAAARLQQLLAGGGEDAAAVTARLRRMMWRCCGIIKSRQSLEAGLQELAALETLRGDLAVPPGGLRAGLECRNLLTLARPILQASLLREESRGCFWRQDFPRPDNDNWLRNIYWRDGKHESQAAVMTRLTSPLPAPIGAGCFSYRP